MNEKIILPPDLLAIDCEKELEKISTAIRGFLSRLLHKRGLVLGISGGIDSSVTAALCVQAVGKEKVIGLQMPERNSAKETMELSTLVADHLGIKKVQIDISPVLEAVGYYRKYDEAVQTAVPGYGRDWKSKIVVSDTAESKAYKLFSIVTESPDGKLEKKRLELDSYLSIVALTNFKQRIRKMLEYYYADLNNFAVAGTPNRLEYDQGFFVKLGDGAADIKPIAHLYKTQVYQLARHLALPQAIIDRPPTTDTYSLPQSQDEFFFSFPYQIMDLCLYGKNNGLGEEEIGRLSGLAPGIVNAIYRDIERKRVATLYLHLPPILVTNVPEIAGESIMEKE